MAIIAVDFDGTLQLQDGSANRRLFRHLVLLQRSGAIIILWTCRTGKRLNDAIAFCASNGLRPNLVNENAPAAIKMLGYNPRKIYADVYLDDKGVGVHDNLGAGLE